jgi:hypothetical protein
MGERIHFQQFAGHQNSFRIDLTGLSCGYRATDYRVGHLPAFAVLQVSLHYPVAPTGAFFQTSSEREQEL